MEVHALIKYQRYSPDKLRPIAREIVENYPIVSDALNVLKLKSYKGTKLLEKAINSALANAINKNMDEKAIRIKAINIDEGPGIKRMRPLSMGKATIIKRRTSHIKVILTDGK